jgi:UrcA family protein
MNTKYYIHNAKSFTCIAASVACAVLLAPAQAKSHEVTVKIAVSTADLDLSQPADARKLYARLRHAADSACTRANIVGLEPVASYKACYEKALGVAVRSVNQLQLRMAYLATHTLDQAAAYGIEIPARMAAK